MGSGDQHGALNRLSDTSRASIMARVDGTRIYDLSVDYFLGMPSFQAAGDPAYQIFMTHTPQGTVVDNLNGMGRKNNLCCGYSGDVILMYTHTGTHIDSLNHFGYGKEIYNKFNADEHLGSRHWMKNGCEQILPIVTRGVLLDIAALQGKECLPESYAITPDDCMAAAKRQETPIHEGDTVLYAPAACVTGRMVRRFSETARGLEACRWLTSQNIVAVGADNEAVEVTPSGNEENWLPGHCHFLAEAGVPQIECLNLEELSRDRLYEFALIAAPIRLRGATGAPLRPLAFPFRPQ